VTDHQALPIDLDVIESIMCWYCGHRSGDPGKTSTRCRSVGRPGGSNVVQACKPCNHLKGKLTPRRVPRRALELASRTFGRLRGRGVPGRSATFARWLGHRPSSSSTPLVAERLDRALIWLRQRGGVLRRLARMLSRQDCLNRARAAVAEQLLRGSEVRAGRRGS
jgi:hypothetical protein